MEGAAKRIQINLRDLADALQTSLPEGFHYLDLQTGEIGLYWSGADVWDDLDDEDEEVDREAKFEDRDRYRKIPSPWSSEAYRLMESFIETLPQGEARERLEEAIQGRKPFRRFKDTLFDLGDLRDRWFAYEAEEYARQARRWLEDEEIDADLV